jgi:hypothetical protein
MASSTFTSFNRCRVPRNALIRRFRLSAGVEWTRHSGRRANLQERLNDSACSAAGCANVLFPRRQRREFSRGRSRGRQFDRCRQGSSANGSTFASCSTASVSAVPQPPSGRQARVHPKRANAARCRCRKSFQRFTQIVDGYIRGLQTGQPDDALHPGRQRSARSVTRSLAISGRGRPGDVPRVQNHFSAGGLPGGPAASASARSNVP